MFTIEEIDSGKDKICESILRALPDWFGIESAIVDYIKAVSTMPMLVAKSGQEIIGFLSLHTHFSQTAEIHVMGVLQPFHRQKVGQQLIVAAQNYLVQKNFRFLTVKTLSESRPNPEYDRTRQFYLKVGFVPVEEFKTLWNEHNPCLFLVKALHANSNLPTPNMFDPVLLETPTVKIRPLSSVSWEKLAEGLLYENSFHARNWGIKTPQDIKKLYKNALKSLENGQGNPIVFLNHAETEVLGMTNFMNVEPTHKMIEIGGTWINQKYQRSSINTETKFSLLQYCFEVLKLNRVEFKIDFENLPSQRAVERLGFNYEGKFARRKINANHETRDYVIYAVTDLTWPAIKKHIEGLVSQMSAENYEDIQRVKDLRRQGNAEDAFTAVQIALSKNPKSAELNYLAASICDAFRTEAEAIPFYIKSLELGLRGQSRRDAFLGIASTYRSLGNYSESKRFFEQGIAEFPEYRPYYVFLALTENNLGNSDKSIKLLVEQLLATSSDKDIVSYKRALEFYATRLNEVFE